MDVDLAAGLVWNDTLNRFISSKHERLAQIIRDYNPNYSLVYVPKALRNAEAVGNPEFAIVQNAQSAYPTIIRWLNDEQLEKPAEILKWLFQGDVIRHRPQDVIARIEAEELAEKVWKAKEKLAETEERHEFVSYAIGGGREKLHTWKHKGKKYER